MCNENKKGKKAHAGGESVVEGRSTAPTQSHNTGTRAGGREGGWRGRARRRCMKAKALQTIVTLYRTSSCYNNTAAIYCTVQVRLNIWLDEADHSLQHRFCPDSACFSVFCSYHQSRLFLLFNSTRVCIYTHTLNTTWKKKKNIKKKTTYKSSFW